MLTGDFWRELKTNGDHLRGKLDHITKLRGIARDNRQQLSI